MTVTGPAAEANRFARAATTHVGRVRSVNQDYAWVGSLEVAGSSHGVALVADGMGGGVLGEESSRIAAEAVVARLSHAMGTDPATSLTDAVGSAHDAVIAARAGLDIGIAPFATTLVVTVVDEVTARAWIANVGDSRAYLLGPRGIQRLTRDHSIVAERLAAGRITEQEARDAPDRSVITRAVGAGARLLIDLWGPAVLDTGEVLLLCSDGVHGLLNDREIARIGQRTPPEGLPEALVAAANGAGGSDNIAVAVLARTADRDPARHRSWRPPFGAHNGQRAAWPMTEVAHTVPQRPAAELDGEAEPTASGAAAGTAGEE